MVAEDVSITPYGKPGDAEAFARLNLAWLEEYFVVEDDDERLLNDPDASIIASGGHILVARHGDRPVGVCALIRVDETVYELAKMAVDTTLRGQGLGRRLLTATIEHARALGAEMLLICTNSRLANAIHLYRDAGFVDSSDPRHHHYDRADVYLELPL